MTTSGRHTHTHLHPLEVGSPKKSESYATIYRRTRWWKEEYSCFPRLMLMAKVEEDSCITAHSLSLRAAKYVYYAILCCELLWMLALLLVGRTLCKVFFFLFWIEITFCYATAATSSDCNYFGFWSLARELRMGVYLMKFWAVNGIEHYFPLLLPLCFVASSSEGKQ